MSGRHQENHKARATTRRNWHGVLAAAILAVAGSATASDNLMKEAIKATAQGDRERAAGLYRELLEQNPTEGYPAYVRFLARTGQTTAVASLLNDDAGFASQPAAVRARALVNAGHKQQAMEVLRAESSAGDASLFERTMLLSNLMEQLGERDEAARVLLEVIETPGLSASQQREMFERLLRVGDGAKLASVFPDLLDRLITSSDVSYPDLRELATAGLMELDNRNAANDFSASLRQTHQTSPTLTWLLALSSVNRGDSDFAMSILEGATSGTLASPAHGEVLLEELARMGGADSTRSIEIYEQLLPVARQPERIRFLLAQKYYLTRNFDKANALFKEMDWTRISGGERDGGVHFYTSSLAATAPMPEFVAGFVEMTSGYPYDRVWDYARGAFKYFSPDNMQALRTAVEDGATTAGSANAWLLVAELERSLGHKEGAREALQKYVDARPDDLLAIEHLAELWVEHATRVATADPQTSPALDVQERVANGAARVLWSAVKLKPYAPEYYGQLISLYRLYNLPEKAREVPRVLAEREGATAEDFHMAGYIYAINGMADLAIPQYEKAIAASDEVRYRLNYAAALGRADRAKDGLEQYHRIIRHGMNGHQYRPADTNLSAMELAHRSGLEDFHVKFLLSLLNDNEAVQRDELLPVVGRVLVSHGETHEALQFFEKFKEEFPERANEATDMVINTYVARKEFETARRLLNEEIAATTDTDQLVLLRNNVALTYQIEGKTEQAVQEWTRLAGEFPASRQATASMVAAAQAAVQAGRLELGRKLYNDYLAMNTGDAATEQIAREELGKLSRSAVEPSSILDSALLEYSGTGAADTAE